MRAPRRTHITAPLLLALCVTGCGDAGLTTPTEAGPRPTDAGTEGPEDPRVDASSDPPEGSVLGTFRWQLP
ncbi:MAG TPA: hypothetical protein VFZ61_30835, partial [Polyangiales bacterium]